MDLPDELTPLNLKAYLMQAFAVCGCAEFEPIDKGLRKLLEWHADDIQERPSYVTLYENTGTFYLLASQLSELGLTEHGTSIRCAWPTPDGERLLEALQKTDPKEIRAANGRSYTGVYY